MSRLRRFLCVLLSFVIVVVTALGCALATAAAARLAYIDSDLNIRADATTASRLLGKTGSEKVWVTLNSEKVGEGNYTWYNITYNGITGYVRGDYVFEIKEIAADKDFETQLNAFPESYRSALRALHAAYPNWQFHAENVSLTLDDAVELEITKSTKLIRTSYKSYLSMGPGAFDYDKNAWVLHDTDWYVASREVIKYYMDPRNFLSSDTVFTFMNHKCDMADKAERQRLETALRALVKNSFLNTEDYIKWIMSAADKTGYNPLVMAAKIILELGRWAGDSDFISGKYPGFVGYYNYFNIRAWGSSKAQKVERALTYAKSKGWDTPEKALIGGAEFCLNDYTNIGQNTYYYMDYNVKNPSSISHQYATAVHDAVSKGKLVLPGITDKSIKLDFYIPVYKNTGAVAALPKESNELNNYYFKSLSVSGLTPSFSMFVYDYALAVSGDTNIAYTVPDGAAYAGNTSFNLKKGENTVVLPVRSQSGYTNDYTITVKADKDCTLTVGGSAPPKEIMRGDTNGDGRVNGRDLANIQMHILGIKALSGDTFTRGDTNSDGKVNGRDLANVQMHILGIKSLT